MTDRVLTVLGLLILIAFCVWAYKQTKDQDEIDEELARYVADKLKERDDQP